MSVQDKKNSPPVVSKLNGYDDLIVLHAKIVDELSQCFGMELDVISNKIIESDALGKRITVVLNGELTNNKNDLNTFSGLLSSIKTRGYSRYPSEKKYIYSYYLKVTGPMHLLGLKSSSRVFQKKDTKTIVETVMTEAGLKGFFSFQLSSGSGRRRDYCVQYNENDLEFVNRLLSEEGWFYRYNEASSDGSIVFLDSNKGLPKLIVDTIDLRQHPSSSYNNSDNWVLQQSIGTDGVQLYDYDSSKEVTVSSESQTKSSWWTKSMMQNCCGINEQDSKAMTDHAKCMMNYFQRKQFSGSAETSVIGAIAGCRFKLKGHFDEKQNQEYIITEVVHHIHSINCDDFSYKNELSIMPSCIEFKMGPVEKKRVYSLSRAIVTGGNNNEIAHTAKGCVKVRFVWEKDKKNSHDNTSLDIPVLQSFAGDNYGIAFMPRVGDYVLVGFIDGDTDIPVVVGAVFAGNDKSPFKREQSGIKTRSVGGDGSMGNMLIFDDTKDKEKLTLHGQCNLEFNSNQDTVYSVGNAYNITVQKTYTQTVKEDTIFTTEKNITVEAKENIHHKADQDYQIEATGNAALTAQKNIEISGDTITVSGTKIKIEGSSSILLAVGGNKIEITTTGVCINGQTIKIDATANCQLSGGMMKVVSKGNMNIEGLMVDVKGKTMTTVSGSATARISAPLVMVE